VTPSGIEPATFRLVAQCLQSTQEEEEEEEEEET
jgi:hypothetical protein